jgi:hypothetical protein
MKAEIITEVDYVIFNGTNADEVFEITDKYRHYLFANKLVSKHGDNYCDISIGDYVVVFPDKSVQVKTKNEFEAEFRLI